MIRPEHWKPADGLTLEPNALKAATERERCLALTAGPGAGKTEMLAQRADFLLRTGTCYYPKRILAISFKVDASRNLKDRVRRRCGMELSDRFDSYTFHAFAKRIIDRFRSILTGTEALDADYKIGERRIERKQIEFSDLVPLAIQILKTSQAARNAIRKTYSDVFLDEFQDCTDAQYKLVKQIFQGTLIRVTAVGDTKQIIMAWAGALSGIFLKFAQDFDAVPLNMYRNFRSQANLLRMQNEIIRIFDPSSVMPEEQIVGSDGEIFYWSFDNSQIESTFLATQIEKWIKIDGLLHSEIAILVSKQSDLYADLLMNELEKKRIIYRNEQQLQDISVEPAAILIVDYLRVLYGTREPKSWIRLMDKLIPFTDEDEQENLRQKWQSFIISEKKEAKRLDLMGERWPTAWTLVIKFLNKIGRNNLTALSQEYESFNRLKQVVQETKTRIHELTIIEPDLLKALNRFADDQAIRILTIHKSKGLEFNTVIILGVEKETFWGKPHEERCAFFVGMSRAKQRLILTTCQTRQKPKSNPYRWDEKRTPHVEFIGYAEPFIKI